MIKISKMTGKLAGLLAVNTNTVTNPFCMSMAKTDTVCGKCYSHKMLSTYRKGCQKAFQSNSELLSSSIIPAEDLPVFNSLYVRLHAHGELINDIHFTNFIRIADKNPKTTFALWTKRNDIVSRFPRTLPHNLILIYSNPFIDNVMDAPPTGFDKVFNVVSKDTEAVNCGAKKCMECLLCYKSKEACIVEKLK